MWAIKATNSDKEEFLAFECKRNGTIQTFDSKIKAERAAEELQVGRLGDHLKFEAIDLDELTVIPSCRVCQKRVEIKVKHADFHKWQSGMLIQNAMPYLSKQDREMLISGTCDACFNKLFPKEEE